MSISHSHSTLLNQEIECFLFIVLLLVNAAIECWAFASHELGSYLTATTHNLKITSIHSHIETIANIPAQLVQGFALFIALLSEYIWLWI